MPQLRARRSVRCIALLLALPGLLAPRPARAEPNDCLLELNDRLLTPHHVSLRLADGRVRAGHVEFIDAGEHYLLFTPDGAAAADPLRLRPAEIRSVAWSYHATNGYCVFGGLLGGAAVGLVAAAASLPRGYPGPNPRNNGAGITLGLGLGLGALTGGLLGLIIPLFHRHDVRVECAEGAGR